VKRDFAGKPGPAPPDRTQNLEFERAFGAQKGSPAKGTGHALLVALQYSQELPENNALFAIWLADFRASPGRFQEPWSSSVG
jgi:hypothetical protein